MKLHAPWRRRLLGLLTAALLGLTASPAIAQPPPTHDAHQRGDHDDRDALRKRVRERIRAARDAMLTEQLQLDADTAAALSTRLDAHDASEHEAHKRVREAHHALAAALEAGSDDATLTRMSAELITRRQEEEATRQALFTDTAALLSPRQQAQLLVTLPDFERRVRRLIRKARRGKRGKGKRGKGKRGRGKHKEHGQ